jgi:trigger factor
MDLKINVKDINPVEKQIQVTIPVDTIFSEVDKYYLSLRKSVKIKGFRPGKVPRSILERFYKKQVENEVVNKLINGTYQSAIKEKNIHPVSEPIIDSSKLETGNDFTYTARVEVHPEIDLEGDYLGLEVEQEKLKVTEDDVDKYLEEIRHYHAQLKAVESDRPIRSGDFVVIDFTGNIEGVPLKEGEVKDKLIEIKPDTFLPGFTNQLIGLRPGVNREIKITIPEDYEQKEIAGKTVTLQVMIKEIKEKIIPSLDDNFARDVGEFETLSELREKVRKEITTREEQRIRNSLHNGLIQKIIENNPFEVLLL